ncbi:MAG: type II toxin-antitoxin system VapC family toxin [Gammaproteobacteria bacterium]|nr:type II toxin-antitoxin system VapC family toxin [Gammaproteobacteria bacterium]
MSRLLLDTRTLLWSLFSPERLAAEAREAILDPSNDVLISVFSAWELAIKRSIGKLSLPGDIEKAVGSSGYRFIGVDPAYLPGYGDLPLREDH